MRFGQAETPAARDRPEPSRWKAAVGVSIAAHLVVGLALVFGFRSVRPQPPTSLSTAVAIQIMPTPSAPAAPAHETPTPEKPTPTPVKNLDAPKLPPLPQVQSPNAQVTLPPEPLPQPPKAAPPPPPAAPAAPAETAAAPVHGTPAQGVTTIEQNYDAQIIAQLERRKRYPGQAMQAHMEDVVYLHMVIDRSGRVLSSEIVRSKHFQPLDNAVRDLAQRVSPLPQMPKGLPGDTYAVTVPIDFFIDNSR